jgi:hypothetical protein
MRRSIKIAALTVVLAVALLAPLAGAQIDIPSTENVWQDAFQTFRNIAFFAIPAIFAIALLIILWGLLMFLRAAGDEDAIVDGKRRMFWGVIIMFAMISVWGLVGVVSQLTGVNQGLTPILPNVPEARSGSGGSSPGF